MSVAVDELAGILADWVIYRSDQRAAHLTLIATLRTLSERKKRIQ